MNLRRKSQQIRVWECHRWLTTRITILIGFRSSMICIRRSQSRVLWCRLIRRSLLKEIIPALWLLKIPLTPILLSLANRHFCQKKVMRHHSCRMAWRIKVGFSLWKPWLYMKASFWTESPHPTYLGATHLVVRVSTSPKGSWFTRMKWRRKDSRCRWWVSRTTKITIK